MTPERENMNADVQRVLLFVGGGCLFVALTVAGLIWATVAALRWALS